MEDKIATESKINLEDVLNLSLKQIKDEDFSLDVKAAIADYLEPLLEKWRQDEHENDKMSKLDNEKGSNKISDASVSIIQSEKINVNVNREARDVSKNEAKEAGDVSNYKDKGGIEVSNCEGIAAEEVSKFEVRESIDASKYETSYSPSTGLYCFQATSKIPSYQFTVGDAAVITRVISPLVKDVIIMNKVRKLRRSTVQIGVVVEGGVQQLEEAIDTANDVLGREKGFQFSPIDNSKDIFSVLGRKDEIPRVDANGVYQLQLKFKLEDIRKEDKARAAAEMGRRLERILENVLVEKICHGPGERMLLFSHTSDIAVARRKLGGCPEFIVAPSKHVWTPRKMEVPVDVHKNVLKPDDEIEDSGDEKKTVVSLLLANRGKNKATPTFKKSDVISDSNKNVSCHGRRVDVIFSDPELALSFFQDVGKMDTKMWSHSVLISLQELGSRHTPSITEEQMMRLAGDRRGEIFNTKEKLSVSTEDGSVIFSFESVEAANEFVFTRSRNKKRVSSLGQLKGTSKQEDEFTLEADEDGFFTLQGPLDMFHAKLLSELSFNDFKITSSSDYRKVYISFPNKMSMFDVLLSQSARQMGLLLHKNHFVGVKAAQEPICQKSGSVDAVKSLVQEIVEAALDGIDQKIRTPNDDKDSTVKNKDLSFGNANVFVNKIIQVQTENGKSRLSDVEKELKDKKFHDGVTSSAKTDENGNKKDNRIPTSEEDQNYQDNSTDIVQSLIREIFEQVFVGKEHNALECSDNLSHANTDFEDTLKSETFIDKNRGASSSEEDRDNSTDIVQSLIREIFEQVFVGKEHNALKCSINLSHANTDFEGNLKSETSIDKNLTSIKEDLLEMIQESSDEDDSHDTEKL